MEKPKVSIVTVTYNCKDEIEETILSVLSQDYGNYEYIIIDGKSQDGTLDLIYKYKEQIDIIISESDLGLYDAMNKGITKAHGDWIEFLNAGDTFYNEKVISTIFSREIPHRIKAIYGDTICIRQDGSSFYYLTAKNSYHFDKLININQPYCHQSVFYNIAEKSDCFYDINYRIAADYNTAIHYYKKYGVQAFLYLNLTVCRFKAFGGVSSSPRLNKSRKKELLDIKIKNKLSLYNILKDYMRLILK